MVLQILKVYNPGLSQRQSQKKLGNIAEICEFISLASFSKEVEKKWHYSRYTCLENPMDCEEPTGHGSA